MKKLLLRLCALFICLAGLLSPVSAQAGNVNRTRLPSISRTQEYNILLIGNSFARDSQQYIGRVLKAAGYNKVTVALMELRGATLYELWNGVENGRKRYLYRVITPGQDIPRFKHWTAKQIMESQEWDVVLLQPKSCYGAYDMEYFYTYVDKDNHIVESAEASAASASTSGETSGSYENVSDQGAASESEELFCEAAVPESEEVFEEAAGTSGEDWISDPEEDFSYEEDPIVEEDYEYECILSEEETYKESQESLQMMNFDETETEAVTESESTEKSEDGSSAEPETETNSIVQIYRKCILDVWVDYIHSYSSDAKVGLMMTWAFPRHTYAPQFKYFNYSQEQMFYVTLSITKKLMKAASMDFLYPAGTAVQNARTSYAGDHLHRDGRHLSQTTGRILAAMLLAKTCGIDVSRIKTIKTEETDFCKLNMPMIRRSINAALKRPYRLTQQTQKRPVISAPKLRIKRMKRQAVLKWKRIKGATGYRIYRKADNGKYQILAEIGAKSSRYVDRSMFLDVRYMYKVEAIGDDLIRDSKASNTVTYIRRSDVKKMKEKKEKKKKNKGSE